MANHKGLTEVTIANLATLSNGVNDRVDGTSRTPVAVLVTNHVDNTYSDQTAEPVETQRAEEYKMAIAVRAINEKGAPWVIGGASHATGNTVLIGYGAADPDVVARTAKIVYPA